MKLEIVLHVELTGGAYNSVDVREMDAPSTRPLHAVSKAGSRSALLLPCAKANGINKVCSFDRHLKDWTSMNEN